MRTNRIQQPHNDNSFIITALTSTRSNISVQFSDDINVFVIPPTANFTVRALQIPWYTNYPLHLSVNLAPADLQLFDTIVHNTTLPFSADGPRASSLSSSSCRTISKSVCVSNPLSPRGRGARETVTKKVTLDAVDGAYVDERALER